MKIYLYVGVRIGCEKVPKYDKIGQDWYEAGVQIDCSRYRIEHYPDFCHDWKMKIIGVSVLSNSQKKDSIEFVPCLDYWPKPDKIPK